MRRRHREIMEQVKESDKEDHMHIPIEGHSSTSDNGFDSHSPQTPHPSIVNSMPSSSPPLEVGGLSTSTIVPQNCRMIQPMDSSFDNIDCKRDITRIIKSNFEKPYTSWKKTDPAVRDVWFSEFKKKWSWEPEKEYQIRKNFEKTASDRMIDLLFNVRKDLTKRPSWMSPQVFEALKEYWNTSQFKTKSEKAKKNRVSKAGGIMHTCGSISMSEHKRRLTMKLGRPVTQAELFLATHKRKDNSGFGGKRLEEIYADFQTQQQEVSSQASTSGPLKDSDGEQPLQPPSSSSMDQILQVIKEAVREAASPINQRLSALEDKLLNRSSLLPRQNHSDH
ncbi:uncharacterized protein LOC127795960 [Diospyros lotus]|uniref:uncharacterized protein LOC127795960 n=1 Tax=Diospyros lotus TaxID=55363 RepID=UPI002251E6D0|nr:uncharacterized protein LOC127795960 [Diospyros lotus]